MAIIVTKVMSSSALSSYVLWPLLAEFLNSNVDVVRLVSGDLVDGELLTKGIGAFSNRPAAHHQQDQQMLQREEVSSILAMSTKPAPSGCPAATIASAMRDSSNIFALAQMFCLLLH